jgi:hypothetical protein
MVIAGTIIFASYLVRESATTNATSLRVSWHDIPTVTYVIEIMALPRGIEPLFQP